MAIRSTFVLYMRIAGFRQSDVREVGDDVFPLSLDSKAGRDVDEQRERIWQCPCCETVQGRSAIESGEAAGSSPGTSIRR